MSKTTEEIRRDWANHPCRTCFCFSAAHSFCLVENREIEVGVDHGFTSPHDCEVFKRMIAELKVEKEVQQAA